MRFAKEKTLRGTMGHGSTADSHDPGVSEPIIAGKPLEENVAAGGLQINRDENAGTSPRHPGIPHCGMILQNFLAIESSTFGIT